MADAPPPDRLERLFLEARARPASERHAFLDAACEDPALRREVEELLASAEAVEAEGFLADPVAVARLGVPAPEADLDGTQVGPYRLLRRLGQGGMGDVYLAEREAPFHRTVALKVMRDRLGGAALRTRFAREQQALASLSHPNIARLYDGGVTDAGRPYFAMEPVEGEPITDWADAHRLGVDARLGLFLDVCAAVQHAHERLVLHRDLKPSNVLVTNAGEAKLLDFGIARLLDADGLDAAPATRTDLRALTPEYASPEQIRGEPLTAASDVYALGVVLYELLTGRRPYRLTRRTPPEVIRAVCEQVPAQPSTAVVQAPASEVDGPDVMADARSTTPPRLHRTLRGDLDAIVMKALRKEPGQRYGSVEQLARDLERFRARRPVLAHRGGRRYRLARFLRRHRTGVAAGTLVGLALVGGAGLALWQASVARDRQADSEAALGTSEAVRSVLAEVLEAGNPHGEGGGAETRDLLARGVLQAETLVDQPLVQAEVFATVGEVYHGLGEFARAEALFERVHALRRAGLGADHPDVAEALVLLSLADVSFGRYDQAEAHLLHAQDIQQARPDTPVAAHVETLQHLGNVRTRLDDLAGAEGAYREAIRLHGTLPVPPTLSLAHDLRRLASTLRRQGEKEEALRYYQTAADLMADVYGAAHPETAVLGFHLGDQLMQMEREDDAVPLFESGIRAMQASYDSTHPRIAHGLHSLARIRVRQGRHDDAEALYRESVAMAHRLYGPDNARTAHVSNLLGDFLVDRGRFDEAEPLYRQSLVVFESQFEPTHRSVLSGLVTIANLHAGRGEYARAEAVLRDVLARRTEAEGPDHIMVAGSTERLAEVLVLQGETPEAETLYLRALAIRDAAQDDGHGAKQRVFAALVAIYEERGDAPEAARFRARVLPGFRAKPLPL